VPVGPIVRIAAIQVALGFALVPQTEPGTGARAAIITIVLVAGVFILPVAQLAARVSHDHPGVHWWAGRVWAMAVPAVFAKTMTGAYDGSGPALAERVTTPFLLGLVIGLSFCLGAQGALLGVAKDVAVNVAGILISMTVVKLQVAFTPAYLLLNATVVVGLALGYICVAKYADLHEALHEAAQAVVVGAAAREPFVVTDHVLNIRAVNQRLLDVLGYEEHELVGQPVMRLLDEASSWGGDHAWIRRTLYEAAARKQCPNNEHVWSMLTKTGQTHPVRITLGETRCPVSAMRMFTAQFTSMSLEHRNAQLVGEKEKLQWEVASHHDGDWEDPREALGASCHDGDKHRTLGAMQDQQTTDDAVSCAQSFDHVASSVESPTLPGHTLIAPAPPRTASPLTTSVASLESSVMDTVSQAAAKDFTRAPPPPKSRPPRPKKVCSEPSAPKPKAGNPSKPKRPLPGIETDPRECS
jgi:PAS domain S-box-containing protein